MTTVGSIIADAIEATGVRPLGDTASPEETNAALRIFQKMLMALPRVVLTEVLISANYTANEDERITDTSGTAVVTKPTTVVDSVTGKTRAPRNGAVVEIADPTTPQRWIYIEELKSWKQVHGLTLASDQPFGPEHDEGLTAMLAARLFSALQQDSTRQPSPLLMDLAVQGRRTIRQHFRQPFKATTDPLLLNVFQRCGTNL